MFIYSPYVLAETNGSFEELITETKLATDNGACDQTALIDKQLFCVKKSRITLNLCGQQSEVKAKQWHLMAQVLQRHLVFKFQVSVDHLILL